MAKIDVRRVGPFEAPMWMALEDNGIRTLTLTVRGLGVVTQEKERARANDS